MPAEKNYIPQPHFFESEWIYQFYKIPETLRGFASIGTTDSATGREEWRKNDYQGILTHLFKLPTLKKLIVGCEFPGIFEKLDVTNEAVDALAIMNSSKADQKSLERKFPNATITYQLD